MNLYNLHKRFWAKELLATALIFSTVAFSFYPILTASAESIDEAPAQTQEAVSEQTESQPAESEVTETVSEEVVEEIVQEEVVTEDLLTVEGETDQVSEITEDVFTKETSNFKEDFSLKAKKVTKGGSIWTTNGSCGAPQNANHYAIGENVYIHGQNFDIGAYNWDITPPGNNATSVANGVFNATNTSEFCFLAYTIQPGDSGVYKVDLGGKNDNYSVRGDITGTSTEDIALAINKDASVDTENNLITYTITWNTFGNATATNFQIVDEVATSLAPITINNGGATSSNTITWNIGDVYATSSGSVSFTASYDPETLCSVINTATGTASFNEETISDVSSVELLGLCSTDEDFCSVGELLNFTIFSNDGFDVTMGSTTVDATTTWTHGAWTASIPGATWISNSYLVSDAVNPSQREFTRSFVLNGSVATATLDIATDNSYSVFINGNEVASDVSENNFSVADLYNINPSNFVTGTNTISVIVNNFNQENGLPESNPTGLLLKLSIDSCGGGSVIDTDNTDNDENPGGDNDNPEDNGGGSNGGGGSSRGGGGTRNAPEGEVLGASTFPGLPNTGSAPQSLLLALSGLVLSLAVSARLKKLSENLG